MVYEFIPIFILMNSKRIVMYQESWSNLVKNIMFAILLKLDWLLFNLKIYFLDIIYIYFFLNFKVSFR